MDSILRHAVRSSCQTCHACQRDAASSGLSLGQSGPKEERPDQWMVRCDCRVLGVIHCRASGSRLSLLSGGQVCSSSSQELTVRERVVSSALGLSLDLLLKKVQEAIALQCNHTLFSFVPYGSQLPHLSLFFSLTFFPPSLPLKKSHVAFGRGLINLQQALNYH